MKSVIKSTALAVIFALGTINQTQASGIPTFDGAAFSGQVQTWLIEAQRWTSQIKQYKQDFDNQKAQLKSLTGARDIDGFLNALDGVLTSNIKNLDKWLDRTDDILKYGKDILSEDLKVKFEKYGATTLCKGLVGKSKTQCEGKIIFELLKQKKEEEDLKNFNARLKDITSIANRMKNAKDMKEAQDLGNAMQTQIALLSADKLAYDIEKEKMVWREKQIENIIKDRKRKKAQQHTLSIYSGE